MVVDKKAFSEQTKFNELACCDRNFRTFSIKLINLMFSKDRSLEIDRYRRLLLLLMNFATMKVIDYSLQEKLHYLKH